MFLFFLISCSSNNTNRSACSSSAECNTLFGQGYVCADAGDNEGYCTLSEGNARCWRSTPSGLYDWEEEESHLVGSLYNASYDIPTLKAVDLVIEQANSAGGLEDKSFTAVHCNYEDDEDGTLDGKSGEEAVQAATRYLVEELQVPVIIGPSGSGDSSYAYDIAKLRPTVLISPSATSPTLSTIDGQNKTDESPGTFWRTVGSDVFQAAVMAARITEDQRSEIIIYYQEGAYGGAFENEVRKNLDITVHSQSFESVDDVLSSENSNLASADGLVFISSDLPDITEFVRMALQDGTMQCCDTEDTSLEYSEEGLYQQGDVVWLEGECYTAISGDGSTALGSPVEGADWIDQEPSCGPYTEKSIYLGDGAAAGDFISMLAEEGFSSEKIERITGTRPGVQRTSSIYSSYTESYNAYNGSYGGSDSGLNAQYASADAGEETYAAYTYDATWIALYGYAWAHHKGALGGIKGEDGTEIARGLRRLSDSSQSGTDILPANWAGIKGALSDDEARINVQGASGYLDFDEDTEELESPIDIWKINTQSDDFCFEVQAECVSCGSAEGGECEDEEAPYCPPFSPACY
jgi:hypothetical protein